MNMVGRFTISCYLFLASPAAFAQTAPIAVAPAAPAAPVADAKPITLESFAATPTIQTPELSPNGKWVAAKISTGGTLSLAMIPLYEPTAKPVAVGLDNAKVDVESWQWVNDDWLIVSLGATSPVEGDKWRLSRVIAVSRATGEVKPIAWKEAAQNAGDIIWVARDGSPRILLGVQNSIYTNFDEFWPKVIEVDVSTGKSRTVVAHEQNISDHYADASGAIRMTYGYDDDARIARLRYRSSGKGRFREIDKAQYRKDEQLISPSLFLAQPDQALTIDNTDGFAALYELDLTTMKRGKRIFGIDGYDIDGLIRNPAGDNIVGIYLTDKRSRIHWIDPDFAATQADLDKAVGAGNASIESWDRSQTQLLVKVGGPDQAGSYFIFDRKGGGTMQRIGYVDQSLKAARLAPVKTITYKARDGLDISAVLTLPKNRSAKSLPLIMLPHGGPGARDSEGWDWWVQFLAWRGYAVIQPNFRGSTGFGNAFEAKGEGEWGLKMQDDLNDAITHLAKEGIADPKRVCIAGASYGGYAAMRAAQRDGALYRCAISYAGVANISAMSRYDQRTTTGNSNRAYWKESAPNSADVSPSKNAATFSIPILLMHGKNDLRVPVDQSRDMASKLKGAGKVYRYVEQPKGDHHFSRQADRLQFLQEMEAWLDLYNPVDVK
jgi:dipeptidyl aminopeptidase/acylaminoacyl peptidase